MELLDKVTPVLDYIRNFILKIAEFLGNNLSINVENIYLILILAISVWLSRRILMFFYTSLEGRLSYWLILSGIIFWVLKYLGVN